MAALLCWLIFVHQHRHLPGDTDRRAGDKRAAAAPWPGLPELSPAALHTQNQLVSFRFGSSQLPYAILHAISYCEIPFIPKKSEVPNEDETTSFKPQQFYFDKTC